MENVLTTNNLKLLFKEEIRLVHSVEYGFSMQDIISGSKPIPKEGARFDIHFAGNITGHKINGTITGIDYLQIRPDGKFILNLHASITTDNGAMIKVEETGTNVNGSLNLNMTFHTSDERYKWLNTKQVIGIGTVDFSTGLVLVKGYSI